MAKKKKESLKPEEEFDFFDIDKNRLDEEWINQPKLFFKISCQLATAQRKESEARASREVIKAEIAAKMRKDPEKYGLEKATEAAINSRMMTIKRYKEAQALRLKRMHRTSILQAAVFALNHRKSALEKLVSLHGQQYFATPQPKDETSRETIEELNKRNTRKAKKRKQK